MMVPSADQAELLTEVPVLDHFPELDGSAHRIVLHPLPFRIGRDSASDYVIFSQQVSKDHAEIFAVHGQCHLRDLNSTNGTYLNGRRVTQAPLRPGDIIHIADKEFRFATKPLAGPTKTDDGRRTKPMKDASPLSIIHGREVLNEILAGREVQVVFQPIVRLESEDLVGFEALGRGTHQDLSPNPGEMFRLAEKCKLAPELSRLFRWMAVQDAARLPGPQAFFFNLHPSEMNDLSFLDPLGEAATAFRMARRRMVLEVHEDVAANTTAMQQFRERLHERNIGLAYDDFGAGQARFTLLTDVPPDYVKLDMNLIRGIDQAPARQDLVRAVVQVGQRLGVVTLAEGIETIEEADTCRQLGCALGQGYLFGKPQPVATLCRSLPTTRVVDAHELRKRLSERRL